MPSYAWVEIKAYTGRGGRIKQPSLSSVLIIKIYPFFLFSPIEKNTKNKTLLDFQHLVVGKNRLCGSVGGFAGIAGNPKVLKSKLKGSNTNYHLPALGRSFFLCVDYF